MSEGEELCLATSPRSEAVLAVSKDVVLTQMAHDVTGDYVFLEFAA
jgi:hypothetical protein